MSKHLTRNRRPAPKMAEGSLTGLAGCLAVIIVIVLNLALLAAGIAVVVWVLRALSVIQ